MLFLLVIARMVGMVRDEERAGALRSAGVELVGATNMQQIHDAASTAVQGDGRRDADADRGVHPGREPRVGAGDAPAGGGAPTSPGWTCSRHARRVSAEQAPESIGGERTSTRRAGDFELTCRGTRVGSLLVSSPVALAHDAGRRWTRCQPGRAGRRRRPQRRGVAPAGGRGAVRVAGRQLDRPDLRARPRRRRGLPEPLDRAGAGLRPVGRRGTPFDRLLRKADRPRLAAAGHAARTAATGTRWSASCSTPRGSGTRSSCSTPTCWRTRTSAASC